MISPQVGGTRNTVSGLRTMIALDMVHLRRSYPQASLHLHCCHGCLAAIGWPEQSDRHYSPAGRPASGLLMPQDVPEDSNAMSFPAFALTCTERIVLTTARADDASSPMR